ncbi:methyltransferase family protein [Rhodococcus zopfii]|uniref:methyltransferase family protein n=1 Tax=Rhodococcus zopfii TaxID=43772 RepID=UPI000933C973|nr:isoprenylcysteine carboxylmethyltransferase family protein [Rhodococcus zopfii]
MTAPLFVAEPLVGLALAVAQAAWFVSEVRIGRRHGPTTPSTVGRCTGLAVGLGLVAVYAGGPLLSLTVTGATITTAPLICFVAGLVIAAVGQGFRLRAVRELGASFTFELQTVAGQRVIDTGPYARIRHPSYTGALICALGFTVSYTNWLAPLTVLVLGAAYVVRIPAEERMLVAELGDPYRRYIDRTWRLVPHLL